MDVDTSLQDTITDPLSLTSMLIKKKSSQFAFVMLAILEPGENQLTVLDNSLPDSMILRHSGIISVFSKKLMTSCSSV